MEGSGTSRQVAAGLGVRYAGFDLRTGFDATRDDLLAATGERAGSIWIHPPYAGMIKYSGFQWGRPHPADISRCVDLTEFTRCLALILRNAYRALAPNGYYGVLIAPWRSVGRYYDLPHLVRCIAPGEIVDVIIKLQHNVSSARKPYAGSFVQIAHEQLFVFRKSTRYDETLRSLDLWSDRGLSAPDPKK